MPPREEKNGANDPANKTAINQSSNRILNPIKHLRKREEPPLP